MYNTYYYYAVESIAIAMIILSNQIYLLYDTATTIKSNKSTTAASDGTNPNNRTTIQHSWL